MRALLTIAHLTLNEAARRRVLLATLIFGLAYVGLFALGFYFVHKEVMGPDGPGLVQRRFLLTFFIMAGLYAVNFLTVVTAVLVPVDTLSGEVSSGVMQTVASKPIRRWQIVLGKWLAYWVVVAGYLTLLAGGVLLAARLLSGVTPANVGLGLSLMLLKATLLLTLTIAFGTGMSTIGNGVTVVGLFGLAFIGGWVEQVGAMASNDTARQLGVVASLVMPSESLWQLAAWHMQPPIMRDLQLTPFSPASVPSPAMVWWAAGYAAVALALGIRHFQRRDL